MAAYVNKRVTYTTTGDQDWIQLNRWSEANDYSIITRLTGTADYDVVFTTDYINRPVNADNTPAATPVEVPVNLNNQTAALNEVVNATPFEAVRLKITSLTGELEFHVMQNGAG